MPSTLNMVILFSLVFTTKTKSLQYPLDMRYFIDKETKAQGG